MAIDTVANCPNADELRAFQAQQLSGLVGQAVHQHVEQCTRCQKALADLRHTVSLRAQASLETPVPQPTASIKSPPGLATFPFLRPPEQSDEIGRLGNYRVLQLLERGGMAFVFQAEDLSLCRPVALKVMKPDMQEDVSAFDRFLREARLLASVKHEHLVTVYQAGREENTVYLAMELLQGCTLESWIRQHKTPDFAQLRRLSLEITSGLGAIHRHGLIHRDVKPSNIWVEQPSNRVKILDFGLARMVRDEVRLTQTGVILGTVQYMAPEQARGGAVDARSDLFSLGCVLYNLATGERPFDGEETLAILTALAVHPPKPIHLLNPGLPKEYADLVMQLLEKDPKNRPASAQAVLERLESLPFDVPSTMVRTPVASRNELPVTQVLVPPAPPRRSLAWKPWAGVGMLALFSAIAFGLTLKYWPRNDSQARTTSEPRRMPELIPMSAETASRRPEGNVGGELAFLRRRA